MVWSGTINGVTNPASINGVPVANIAKVNGIEGSTPPTVLYDLLGDATAFGGMATTNLDDQWIDLTTTQYLTTPILSDVADGKMLFAMWINCASFTASQQTWLNASNSGASRVLQALIETGARGSRLYFEGSATTARDFAGNSGQGPLVPNDWVHLCWSCNGTGYQWENWVNGVLMPVAGYSNHGSYNMSAQTYWGRNGSGSQQTTAKASSGVILSEYFGQHFGASVIADLVAAGPFGRPSDALSAVTPHSEWWVGEWEPPTDGLTHYYDFATDANDQVGAIDGTISGAASITSPGIMELDGSTGRCMLSGAAIPSTLPFTATFWVNSDQITSQEGGIYSQYFNLQAQRMVMVLRTGYVRIQIGDSTVEYSTSLTDHAWHQIVFRRDAASLVSIGVNGAIGQSGTISGPIDQQAGEIGGYRQDTSSSNWNGKIGECRFYNRALSDSEISKLYDYDKDLGPY